MAPDFDVRKMTLCDGEGGRMRGYTPEPWTADIPFIYAGKDERTIVEVLGERMNDETWANARRIVACVNACAGIPTEWIENKAALPLAELKAEVDAEAVALRQQVADLRVALVKAQGWLETVLEEVAEWDDHDGKTGHIPCSLVEMIRRSGVLAATQPQEVQA